MILFKEILTINFAFHILKNYFIQNCPYWSLWSTWSQCAKTCDSGFRNRERKCVNGIEGEEGCLGSSFDVEQCPNPVRNLL